MAPAVTPARTEEAAVPREVAGTAGAPRLPGAEVQRPFAAREAEREPRIERPREPRVERPREPRIERPREPRVERPREIEPLPPAMAEDEIEEIGRPEGPPGERFMDPFASETEARGRTEREGAAEIPATPRNAGVMREEEEPVSDEPEMERFARPQPNEPGGSNATGESKEKKAPGAGSADRGGAPSYGRRPGRGRR